MIHCLAANIMHTVKLIQESRYRWAVISPKGHKLVDDLLFASQYKAEEWLKSYISSFMGWTYVIIPLGGTKNENNKIGRN